MKVNLAYYTIPGLRRTKTTEDDIISFICDYFKLTRSELMQKNRTRERKEARFICFALLRFNTRLTLVAIAKIFGFDHSSIIHGIKTHHNLMHTEPEYKERFQEIEFLLKLKSHTQNAK